MGTVVREFEKSPAAASVTATGARPTVGIVGAGQLARMGWQAAISLDLDLVCLGAAGEAAVRVGVPLIEGSGHDATALAELSERSDVLTFEHELVDLSALADLEDTGTAVRPSAAALALAVDKLHQRQTLSALAGVEVPAFSAVGTVDEVEAFAALHGWPLVLKARRGGYDGRGVWMCLDRGAVEAALEQAGVAGIELYAEQAVDLSREVAIIVARSRSGEVVSYAPVETHQVDGMCRSVVMPAGIDERLSAEAERIALVLARHIGLEGLMAVELFVTRDGRLLVNELALRTHNTGHLHTEATATSQFEQHLRAVLDLPLGATTPIAAAAAMVNIVGPADGSDPASRLQEALRVPGASVHLYGKDARPGRKLGHVTVCAATPSQALVLARQAADRLEGNG